MATRVMESRAYDSHYDPVFTWSGDRPRQGGIPAWTNSVTVVNNAPRSNYRSAPRTSINAQFRQTALAQTIPAIMPDGTIGRIPAPPAATTGPSIPRVVGINGPMSATQVQQQLTSEVLGRSRVKFFKRPVIPFLSADGTTDATLTPEQQQAHEEAQAAHLAEQRAAAESAVIELHRTFGTQTDYRESETQTDPYTPDYITAPEEPEPEILALAHLTYGQGLPASLDELTLIKRMREKKAFEASLPPITDAASFEKRKKMLEERELSEWALREQEMKEEQNDRLQILIDTLKLREAKVEELNEQRIDLIRQQRLRTRDQAFDAIHHERIKLHRALGKQRVKVEEETAHMSGGYKDLTSSHTANRRTTLRDIVGEYADHASQVYAPVQRDGKLPVKNQVVDYGIPLIQNFQGLVDLEKHLPSNVLNVKLPSGGVTDANGQQQLVKVKSLVTRKGQAIRADLEYVDSLLEQQRREGGPVGAILGGALDGTGVGSTRRRKGLIENVYKKFEPVVRAPTPSVPVPDAEEAGRAILLLQRLLRGRLVQNNMYRGKEHHAALIRELRMAEHPPAEVEPDYASEALHHALDTLQGELLATSLDFVAKEVTRREEEASIAALVHQAALTRRHREVEEAGRRQAEECLRAKRERQLAELMSLHSQTADRYLDELLEVSINTYARQEAEQATPTEAAAAAASDDPDAPDRTSSEFLLGDLVASYILPEVERRATRRKEELQDRRFIKQAHEAVFQAIESMQPDA